MIYINLNKKKLVIIALLLSTLLLIGGFLYLQKEREQSIREKEKHLSSIAQLKSNQISNWFLDELKDANTISQNKYLKIAINDYFSIERTDSNLLMNVLFQKKAEHDYYDIALTSLDGHITTATSQLNNAIRAKISLAVKQNTNYDESTLIDWIYLEEPHNIALIGFLSPVKNFENETTAFLVFLLDADDYLYPLLDFWPEQSPTSELFICMAIEDSVVYINPLRHVNSLPFQFKFPLTKTELPAVLALQGKRGIVKGTDYRSEEVFAYINNIKNTPWYIVAKIDKTDMYKESYLMTFLIILIIIFLISTIFWALLAIFQQQQIETFKKLYSQEKEIHQSNAKFEVALNSLGEGVISADKNGKILYVNKIAERLTGWSIHDAKGLYISEVYKVKNEDTNEIENNVVDKVLKHGLIKETANHTVLISRNGAEIPVSDTGAPIFEKDGSIIGIILTFSDETEKRNQQRLLKESEERLRTSLENMIEGCQIINFEYQYLFMNKSAIASSKKAKDDLIGKTMMECFEGIENTDMFKKLRKSMEERVPVSFENEFNFPDNEKRIFNLKFEPVPEGLLILSEDITDLRKSQEHITKFKMGIELSTDAVFITDKEGKITYVNPAFQKIFGHSSDEVLGKTPRVLKSGEFSQKEYETFWDTLLSNKPVHHEIINKTKNDKLLYIEASITPINDSDGEIIGYLAIERDITERKIAEMESNQLKTIIEATPDFVGIANTEGMPIYINKSGLKMLGMGADINFSEMFITDMHPTWAGELVLNQGFPTAAKDGVWEGETVLLTLDGKEIPVSQIIIAHYANDGSVDYYSTIARDLMIRKKYEQELIEAKLRAEESDRLKSAFLLNISHEIRTPMNGIIGFMGLLQDPDLDSDTRDEYITLVNQSGQRLMKTIHDIVDLSKIEAGQVEVKSSEVNIEDLMNYHFEFFKTQAEEKGLKLYLNEHITGENALILSDETKINGIISNLLNNAVKFTEKGKIEFGNYIDNNSLVFYVKDSGIGISNDRFEAIFDRFVQADLKITRGHEGLGLGLSIVKSYIHALNGRIWVESETDKGSTFYFVLPYLKVEDETSNLPAISYQNTKDFNKHKILIAEDDIISYKLLLNVLKQYEFEILHAKDGEETIEMLKSAPSISLILMDIQMPKMNGLIATRKIREFNKDIPIIAQTSYAQMQDIDSAVEAGCNDYISKPLNFEYLLELIEKHLI